jgi:hypothetical protein
MILYRVKNTNINKYWRGGNASLSKYYKICKLKKIPCLKKDIKQKGKHYDTVRNMIFTDKGKFYTKSNLIIALKNQQRNNPVEWGILKKECIVDEYTLIDNNKTLPICNIDRFINNYEMFKD